MTTGTSRRSQSAGRETPKTNSASRDKRRRLHVDTTRAASGPLWRRYLTALGPGLVTGASDDDPSGIATYSQAGAKFGYGLLWTSLLTFPLMSAVQEMCDRTALATGQGIGELAVKRFSRWPRRILAVLIGALIIANALNIAADLVAVGAGMNLLGLGPTAIWAMVAGVVVTALVTTGSFETIARVFKVLCVALLAYLGVLILAHPSWPDIAAHTLVPHIEASAEYAALVVAVLGTTISPYLFFWQSAHRLEELRDEPVGGESAIPLKERATAEAKSKERISRADVFTGMAFSNIVMFAIIIAGAQLAFNGTSDINSAADAAQALKPVAGDFAKVLFALGFIGSGMLAIPVLAGSGAVGMAGLLGERWGFSKSPRQAPVFHGLVAVGTIGGTVLSLLHVNPISLLLIVATVNGVAAAPFLIVVVIIANSGEIMGSHRNGRTSNILVGITIALMTAAAVTLIATGSG
jgi:NRAMP (natural resistance-associated macrophage protein)-like metal ion transporter